MADIVHQAGVQAILQHWTKTQTLENAVNCLFAVLVQADYTPLETHATMASVATLWTGVAANGGATTTAPLVVPVASVTVTIDGDGHVRIVVANLSFGTVSTAGAPVKHCTLYVEKGVVAAGDADRYPLLTMTSVSAVQPVGTQGFTWLTNATGNVLFNLNP